MNVNLLPFESSHDQLAYYLGRIGLHRRVIQPAEEIEKHPNQHVQVSTHWHSYVCMSSIRVSTCAVYLERYRCIKIWDPAFLLYLLVRVKNQFSRTIGTIHRVNCVYFFVMDIHPHAYYANRDRPHMCREEIMWNDSIVIIQSSACVYSKGWTV